LEEKKRVEKLTSKLIVVKERAKEDSMLKMEKKESISQKLEKRKRKDQRVLLLVQK